MTNHLRELETAGQAVWLDYLHREIDLLAEHPVESEDADIL